MYFIRVCSKKKGRVQQTYIINTNGCTIFATFSTARRFYNLYYYILYTILPVTTLETGAAGRKKGSGRATRVIKMIHSTVVCVSSYYFSSFRCGLFSLSLSLSFSLPIPTLLSAMLYATVERQRSKVENIFINWPTSNQATRTAQKQQRSSKKYNHRILYLHKLHQNHLFPLKIFITVIFHALSKINMRNRFDFRKVNI